MADNEISKLSEEVPDSLLEDNAVKVYILDGEEIVSEYSTAVELENPYTFNANRFLPNEKVMDLPRFFTIASELIADAQKREGKTDYVYLTEEYPPEPFHDIGDELITYRILKSADLG